MTTQEFALKNIASFIRSSFFIPYIETKEDHLEIPLAYMNEASWEYYDNLANLLHSRPWVVFIGVSCSNLPVIIVKSKQF